MTELMLLILALVAAAGVLAVRRRHRDLRQHLSAEDKAMIHVRWHAIEQSMRKGGAANLRSAVLEADKLVDYALRQLGIPGETMGERLRSGKHRFSDLNGIWSAHKVRNQVVHEIDKELLSFEAKRAVARFKQALTDLGAL